MSSSQMFGRDASHPSVLRPVQQIIAAEIDALEQGELRSAADIERLFTLLSDATPEQLARAEKLQIALLARGAPLTKLPALGIEIVAGANGSKNISYYEVLPTNGPLSERELNPDSRDCILFEGKLEKRFLGRVEDARLVTPTVSTLRRWSDEAAAERVHILMQDDTRITYHRGIPATWDKNVDRKAWSTNIDTIYFSDWLRAAGAFNDSVRVAAEVGSGIGGISQALLSSCPNLEKHTYTDIDPNAINATRRNLRPLAGKADVSWFIGKGIKGLVEPGTLDLLVTNPPYIPNAAGDADKDHYSGTKLIKRLFEDGIPLLNPDNPCAAIYIQMSSVTLKDFTLYQKEHPDVAVTPICSPVRVPLRILGLLREPHVIEFLKVQGGLEFNEKDPLQYYHRIMAFKLSRKA